MNDKITEILTNTKLVIGICSTIVGVLFFFFMLRADIKATEKETYDNTTSIEAAAVSNSKEHKELRQIVTEYNTSIKLIQKDVEYIKKSIDKE
jgi:hypothetical protein